jgi:hypothetical protein
MCSLGPEGGVCACVDQPLLLDPPNIYFVLDRSGSMAENNKWGVVQAALIHIVASIGPRASFGAAVFPDPTLDGCLPGREIFAPRRGDAPAETRGPTVNGLVLALGAIPAAGGTPTASSLAGLLSRLQSLPGKTYVILATDGGPNCNEAANCAVTECTANIDNSQGCPTGGTPNCCSSAGVAGPTACLDVQPTLDAVSAIASANMPVYIIGVPGSAPYANLLDQLAVAGGTARGTEPQYYAIDTVDQTALQTVLANIAAKITGTCTLTLDNPPPEASLVNVFLNEKPLPQAGPDGWTLDGSVVTIEGKSCDEILQGSVLDVRVVAGCPTVMF